MNDNQNIDTATETQPTAETTPVFDVNENVNTVDATPVENVSTETVPTAETTEDRPKKRTRLKHGTGIKVKRVVLMDGKPVGRGKPKKDTISGRTVVYIPVNATYDVNIYGTGTQYKAYRGIKAIKTVKRETYLAQYPNAKVD